MSKKEQRVVTIVSNKETTKGEKFSEMEYPKLNKYLESGYLVKDTIPVINPANSTNEKFAVIFILQKEIHKQG